MCDYFGYGRSDEQAVPCNSSVTFLYTSGQPAQGSQGWTTHTELGPPSSINNKKCLHANLMGTFFSIKVTSSQMNLDCIILTKNLITTDTCERSSMHTICTFSFSSKKKIKKIKLNNPCSEIEQTVALSLYMIPTHISVSL